MLWKGRQRQEGRKSILNGKPGTRRRAVPKGPEEVVQPVPIYHSNRRRRFLANRKLADDLGGIGRNDLCTGAVVDCTMTTRSQLCGDLGNSAALRAT